MKAVPTLDVKGFPQGAQACFVEGLAQGRMRVDGAADIFQPRPHLEREAEGGGEFRHPGADGGEAQQPSSAPKVRARPLAWNGNRAVWTS